MITWMQKHKKYLVVTIWISTIAFVGAGVVGWGAYDFNADRTSSIAKVGHRKISVKELQDKYSEFYNYYNQLSDGQLTEEKANEIGIENLAVEALVQENLLLNFADDLGLGVNENDIASYIIADPSFQTNGKFDEALYRETLKRNRIKVDEFENRLKNRILLDKLRLALNVPSNAKDSELMLASFLMQDRVSIKILKAEDSEVSVDEAELKTLWESTKNNYKIPKKFEIKTKLVKQLNLDANESDLMEFYTENKSSYKDPWDKILEFKDAKADVLRDYTNKKTKEVALKEYLRIKKGEEKIETEAIIVSEDDTNFPTDELKNSREKDVLKPVEHDDGFVIIVLEKIIPSQTMSYDEAKDQVVEIYKAEKEKKIIESKAKQLLKDGFKGVDIGFVSRDSIKAVDGLSEMEYGIFVSKLFDSNSKKGYVMLDNKAVVYEILEQKLLNTQKEDEYKNEITQNVSYLKNSELIQDLTNALQKRYEVEYYYKR